MRPGVAESRMPIRGDGYREIYISPPPPRIDQTQARSPKLETQASYDKQCSPRCSGLRKWTTLKDGEKNGRLELMPEQFQGVIYKPKDRPTHIFIGECPILPCFRLCVSISANNSLKLQKESNFRENPVVA